MIKRLFGSIVLACFSFAVLAQTVTFTAEQITASPAEVASAQCVQVGIFMTYEGTAADYSGITFNIDYTLPAAGFSATPMLAVFPGNQGAGNGLVDNNGGTAGGGNVLLMGFGGPSSCTEANMMNGVTLGSATASDFLTQAAAPLIQTPNIAVGSATTGHISYNAVGTDFVNVGPGTHLVAVVEFPLAAFTANGQVDVAFTAGVAQNFLQSSSGAIDAILDDGWIQIFDTIDCGDGVNFADFDDVNGSTTGTTVAGDSSMSIAYHDSSVGGVGGQVTASINYGVGVSAFQLTGTDGYDSGIVVPDGTSPDPLAPTALDGLSPSVTYTLTYFVLGLDGITNVPGSSCNMVVSYRDATCTAAWVNNGINTGTNSTYTVTLTNPMPTAGVFGSVNSDGTPTGIVVPIDVIAGMGVFSTVGADTVITFTVINEVITNGDWGGTWTLTGAASPNGTPTSCADGLGFTCPVMTSASVASPVDIGGDLVVTFAATDALSFDLVYNGVTTSGVTSPHTLVGAANGGDVDVTVTANGFGPDGSACTSDMVAAVTFSDATCGDVTLVPAPPVDGYSVGDSITTIAVDITGASSVTIAGVACTPSVDPDANVLVTWTYPNAYTVMGPDSLVVVATNPNGVTTTCDAIVIDVDCTEANIESISPAGSVGNVVIEGIEGLDYEIWYGPCGQTQFDTINGFYVGDVTIGPDVDGDSLGEGTLAGVTIVEDVCYYVVCPGDIIASNSMIRTVPTLGEWGSAIFVVLVMFAGLVILRRKN